MVEYLSYAFWAFLAGAGIPVLMALNSHLGRGLANPPIAVIVLFTVGLLSALTYALIVQAPIPELATFAAIPAKFYLGGMLMAFYGVSVTIMAPRFGVGNTVLFVVCAQMCISAVIDAWGLFGMQVRAVDSVRILGLAVVVVGLVITQLGPVFAARK